MDTTSAAPIRGSDTSVLRRKWNAARKPGRTLPAYEDVFLGSLGRLADHLILSGGENPARFKVMRTGQWIEQWVGADMRGHEVHELPPACAHTISEAIARSLLSAQPTCMTAHGISAGVVTSYEIMALPMDCRWSSPVVGVYINASTMH
jgi:hypothetical protein